MEKQTLRFEIPKEFETLDIREGKEGDQGFIEVDVIKKSDMCNIKLPHNGFDCPCYIR